VANGRIGDCCWCGQSLSTQTALTGQSSKDSAASICCCTRCSTQPTLCRFTSRPSATPSVLAWMLKRHAYNNLQSNQWVLKLQGFLRVLRETCGPYVLSSL